LIPFENVPKISQKYILSSLEK